MSKLDNAISSIYRGDMATFEQYVDDLDGLNSLDGRTLLFYAVLENNLDALMILLSHFINLDIQNNNGWIALHHAANFRKIQSVRYR